MRKPNPQSEWDSKVLLSSRLPPYFVYNTDCRCYSILRVFQLQNQSELRAPTPEKAAWFLDAAIAARYSSQRPSTTEEEHRNSHMLFTLHIYQYRMEKTGKGGSKSSLFKRCDIFPFHYHHNNLAATERFTLFTPHIKSHELTVNQTVRQIITGEQGKYIYCFILWQIQEGMSLEHNNKQISIGAVNMQMKPQCIAVWSINIIQCLK